MVVVVGGVGGTGNRTKGQRQCGRGCRLHGYLHCPSTSGETRYSLWKGISSRGFNDPCSRADQMLMGGRSPENTNPD